jgi:hypothetical protein
VKPCYEGPTIENGLRHGEGEGGRSDYVCKQPLSRSGWGPTERFSLWIAGTCVFPDGSRYEGSFVRDKRHGHGVMHYPDGSRYVGEFREDEPNGEGSVFFKNGDTYAGAFKVRREGSGCGG